MNKFGVIGRYLKYLRSYIWKEALILILMIISGAGSLATPYALKIIIDDIFPSGNYRQLVGILAALMAIYIVRILCTVITDIMYTKVSVSIVADIRADIFSNVMARPLLFFKSAKLGEIIFTVMNDVENIQTALSSLILNFLNNFISVVGILIMLGILNFRLTLISLLILPLILISIRKFTPHLQKSFRGIQEAQEKMSDFFLEIMRNIRAVRSYNTLAYESERLAALQDKVRKGNVLNTMLNSLNSNITTFFVATGPVIVLIYGGRSVFSGAMTIGGLIAFIQYLNRLYAPTMSIMESYNHLTRSIVSMQRVSEYLPHLHPSGRLASSSPVPPSPRLPDFTSISFNKVSLVINNTEILKGIDLHFEKGNVYGIIGPSGSGKSSIINMLCGFFQPTSGSIVLDRRVKISDLREWSQQIGLIEKENQLFHDTVIGNIRYGSFQKSENEVARAVHHAGFTEVLKNLPEGYGSVINETGTSLSDGQKQRISIARALLKSPSIILFDEATAALDQKLERTIIANLRKYYNGSIIIFVTHRLSSLEEFDYVYEINGGRVSNEGAPSRFSHEFIKGT
ncbi:MAG TPA: ABC transporter ATP-binding protein [Puia sp.]|jgi:ABC-type multidrug transport system fused ATPase/permease subunit|nr:ABC transporter ATP-binding protein [Puia sp.]